MITIGLDLSINSSGVCLNDDGEYSYYIITPHITKSQKQVDVINYIEYQKGNSDSENIRQIGKAIEGIIKKHTPQWIVLEDVAMSARSRSIITLTLLNGYIRAVCDYLCVDYITVPPTQWKKKMIGNGGAKKDVIVHCFEGLQPQFKGVGVKIDDICDAYFLSHYIESKRGLNPYNHVYFNQLTTKNENR